MKFNAILKIITCLFIASFIISCSNENNNQTTTQQSTKSQKKKIETVKERALARWNALIEKDWTAAYSYESPNYRKNYSRRDFINSFGQAVTWIGIKHLSTTPISETLSDVNLELQFNYDMGGNLVRIPSNITERWQLVNNKWWHVKK
jgi:hypothetical protein